MSAEGYEGPDLGRLTAEALPEGEADLSDYRAEDWLTLIVFWVLAVVVFLQFFTRYALNNSIAWTEEIARYLLTIVAFVGGGMAVRRQTHIQVEFLYVYIPRRLGRRLSVLVDVIRVLFFAYATWLSWKVTQIMQTQPMVVVDWPMSIVYGFCTLGLLLMTWRALQVGLHTWRTGTSALTRVSVEGRHQ